MYPLEIQSGNWQGYRRFQQMILNKASGCVASTIFTIIWNFTWTQVKSRRRGWYLHAFCFSFTFNHEHYLGNKGQKLQKKKDKKTRHKWNSKLKSLQLDIVRNLVLYLLVNDLHLLNKKNHSKLLMNISYFHYTYGSVNPWLIIKHVIFYKAGLCLL